MLADAVNTVHKWGASFSWVSHPRNPWNEEQKGPEITGKAARTGLQGCQGPTPRL